MIKAIFFDIDGTLISFKTHKIPQDTLKSLYELKNKGIKLFISTGRPKIDILKIQEIVDFPFDGFISINGQYCYDNNGTALHKQPLDNESVKQILNYTKEHDLSCHVITEDNVYVTKLNDRVYKLFELVGYQEKLECKEEEYFFDKTIFQLCPYVNEEEEKLLMKDITNCETHRWCDLFTDVIPIGGGKAYGIKKVCEYYKIDKSETMAFGDGGNDIDMLQYVQYGIAMGNASDEVKSCANYITTDVDDCGITNALRHFNLI